MLSYGFNVLAMEASYNGLRTIDNKLKLIFLMDIQAAAKLKLGKRKDFIKTEEVKVSRYHLD
jgi:hypothetical protein